MNNADFCPACGHARDHHWAGSCHFPDCECYEGPLFKNGLAAYDHCPECDHERRKHYSPHVSGRPPGCQYCNASGRDCSQSTLFDIHMVDKTKLIDRCVCKHLFGYHVGQYHPLTCQMCRCPGFESEVLDD